MNEPKLEIKGDGRVFSLYIDGNLYKSYSTWEEANREKERIVQASKNKPQNELLHEIGERQKVQRRFKP